jgi:hypothetical protein
MFKNTARLSISAPTLRLLGLTGDTNDAGSAQGIEVEGVTTLGPIRGGKYDGPIRASGLWVHLMVPAFTIRKAD